MSVVILVILASILALAFAAFNFAKVKKLDEGTDKMKEIAGAIRIGANAFMNYEYKVLYSVVAIVAVIMALLTSWQSAVARELQPMLMCVYPMKLAKQKILVKQLRLLSVAALLWVFVLQALPY